MEEPVKEYAQLKNIDDKTIYPICLDNGILSLGSIRSDDANVDILLPYKDIDLIHCQLKITNQQVELYDLSIGKNVKVNGRCLMRPMYLRSFDEVVIGSQKLKFCYKEDYEVSHEELNSKKDCPEDKKVSVKNYEKRKAKPCPYCKKPYVRLPEHVKKVHNKSAGAAAKVALNFGMRKKKISKKPPKRKRTYVSKYCAVEGCYSTPVRISNHLLQTHKFKPSSMEYRKYLHLSNQMDFIPEEKEIEEKEIEEKDVTVSSESDDSENESELYQIGSSVGDNIDEDIEENFLKVDLQGYSSDSDASYVDDENGKEAEVEEIEESDVNECIVEENVEQEEDTLFMLKLKEYEEWQCGIDGGQKKTVDALQNVSQVNRIMTAVDSSGNLESLLNIKNVRDKWLTPFKALRKAGTVRSYCNSLKSFCDFLEISQSELPLIKLRAIQTQAKTWGRILNKSCKRREYAKIYDDFNHIVSPDQVQEFEQTNLYLEALSIFEKFSAPTKDLAPTLGEYTLVRDVLVWDLSIDNGGRPGPFMDMTLHEIIYAQAKGEKGEMAIPRFIHKTDATHGPAQIVISKVLHKKFMIFIKFIRGKLFGIPQHENSRLFVSHKGNPLTSKHVSGRLTALWQKSNCGTRMNNTLIRKSITTYVRKNQPELAENVAHKLCHNPETAEKFYNVIRKGEAAIETSDKIRTMFRGNVDSKCNVVTDTSSSTIQSRNLRWSKEEEELLTSHFKESIISGTIKAEAIREAINSTTELCQFKNNIKRVVDKLRYMIDQNNTKNNLSNNKETSDSNRIDMEICEGTSMGGDAITISTEAMIKCKKFFIGIKKLQDVLESLKSPILRIFGGKDPSQRHVFFKGERPYRGHLEDSYQVGPFTSDHVSQICKFIVNLFRPKRKQIKHFSYIKEVLVPDTCELIYGKLNNLTKDEVYQLFKQYEQEVTTQSIIKRNRKLGFKESEESEEEFNQFVKKSGEEVATEDEGENMEESEEEFKQLKQVKTTNKIVTEVKKTYPSRAKHPISSKGELDNFVPTEESDIEADIETESSSYSRLLFSDDTDDLLKRLFQKQISGKLNIRQNEVLDSLEKNAPHLLDKFTIAQLITKVRTQKRAADRLKLSKIRK